LGRDIVKVLEYPSWASRGIWVGSHHTFTTKALLSPNFGEGIEQVPDFQKLGTLRFVRDVLAIPGCIDFDGQGHLLIMLNAQHPWARPFTTAFSSLLARDDLSLVLGQI
jgi:hypothetical protein